MQRSARKLSVGLALLAAAGLGSLGALSIGEVNGQPVNEEVLATTVTTAAPIADTLTGALSSAFRTAAKNALPGVVHIRVESTRMVSAGGQSPFEGTPFEDYFRSQPQQQGPRMGSGSGFVFRPDGYILTNNHVVDGATEVTVIMPDKREFSATVVGRDPNTDLAVVKVDADGLPVLTLGDSDALQVGDWVVALGYPLELGSTVTAGIVSAKGKSIGIIARDDQASAPLEHFIQTDAAINPGNSGGPLVDLNGRVVGINSAIASPTGYYSGYGFAVPISLANRIATDLIEHGEVRRPKLGIGIRNPTLADAEVAGLATPLGALVASVEEDSPADDAGLRMNDAIVAVEGRMVESAGDLMEMIARQEPGSTVSVEVVRSGERLTLEVELDDSFAPSVAAEAPVAPDERGGLSKLGFAAADMNASMARQLGVAEARGVVVTDVDPSSPSGRAGVRPGMIVESLNGTEIESRQDLEEVAGDLEEGSVASMIVRLPTEGGQDRTVLNFRVS